MVPKEDLSEREPGKGDRLAWSSLMARAQDGDQAAYRQLLYEIAGYLRSLVAQHHRNPTDVEDTVQDVLLTIHTIRHTYDPSRPFGPWLVTIARRLIIDTIVQFVEHAHRGRHDRHLDPLPRREFPDKIGIDICGDAAGVHRDRLREPDGGPLARAEFIAIGFPLMAAIRT